MIKFDIRSRVLDDRKDDMVVKAEIARTIIGKSEIVENEIYVMLKDLKKECPYEWMNALERVMTDSLGGDEE